MRRLLIASLLTAACGAGAAAQEAASGPSRYFGPQDLFSLEQASDPQIRPDGGAVAYVRATGDVMTDRMNRSIWVADTAGGGQRPVAAGAGQHSTPRWSPDGRRLAYVSTAEGDKPQLYVRWMDSGATARVASLPDAPGDIAWSPDGTRLAFTMFSAGEGLKLGKPLAKPEGAKWADALRITDDITYRTDAEGYLKPGYTHIWVVSADGGAPRQVTFGEFNDTGPLEWTPDGRAILYSANREEGWRREPVNSEIYQVTVADGTVRALTRRAGPDESPAVSPDGSKIAYVGFDDRKLGHQVTRLHVMNRDGSDSRVLTANLDRAVGAPQWAGDGRSIYVQYVDQGVSRLARVGLDGRVQTLDATLGGGGLDRPYSGGAFTVANNGVVAFTTSSVDRPADLAVLQSGRIRPLTRLNAELFSAKALGRVEPLKVTSSADGRPVDAWLVLPPGHRDGQKHPLILEIHGGPFQSYGPYFATDMQLYASAGYAVLYVNPRGSTSYGEDFANLIHHAYPGQDYDDLMSAVDGAIARGVADPNQLFVTGGSGGGVLTAWIIGKTDRFKGAAVQKPVVNWTSTALTTDISTYMPAYWFAKKPWEDPESYWKRSPLSLVGNVKTPTLVVVGEKDYRTPVSEAEQYYQALQLEQVPTAFVVVPGASHGGLAARPSQSAAKASAIIAWFDRYRTPAAQAASAGAR